MTLALGGCYSGLADADIPAGEDPGAPGDAGDEGSADSDSEPDPEEADCNGDAEATPLLRLTRQEYDNTVRDLVGVDLGLARAFTADTKVGPFDANFALVSELGVEQYLEAAEEIATVAVNEHRAELLPSDCAAQGDDACADAFIDAVLARAFRRPIEDAERQEARALFELGVEQAGFDRGVELVIRGALNSPMFLYRVESGGLDLSDASAGEVVTLTHYEVASRLSYTLWQTMPDAELFAAAERGELGTRDEIGAQALRMLEDPRARDAVGNFHSQWLEMDLLDETEKVDADFDQALATSMRVEVEALANHVVFDGSGRLAELFESREALVDEALAGVYGVPFEGQPGERVWTELPAEQRAGVLTRAGFLSANSHPNKSFPTKRGRTVRQSVFCQLIADPPPEADDSTPEPGDAEVSFREYMEQKTSAPLCSSCHTLLDPIGFGLEHYGPVGRWRTLDDNGFEVDASGSIVSTDDADGEFYGGLELSQQLAGSAQVRKCMAKQAFQFAYRRGGGGDDQCTVDQIVAGFESTEGDMRELLLSLVTQDAFLTRVIGE